MTTHQKNLLSATILFLFFIIAIASSYTEEDKAKQRKTDIENDILKKPTYKVLSLANLWKTYEENEVAANEKYWGKVLQTKGEVISISEGTLHIATPNSYGAEKTMCWMASLHSKELAKLKKGQIVNIKGICKGLDAIGSPYLDECAITN